jgi:hypothetical protein
MTQGRRGDEVEAWQGYLACQLKRDTAMNKFSRVGASFARFVLALAALACLTGQMCAPTGGPAGWTGDPYGTWSAGLRLVAVPTDPSANPNALVEGDASVETWTFTLQGDQTILTIASGSTFGQAAGTLTSNGNTFHFEGESSVFDSLGIHIRIAIDGLFTGLNNFEGTKRTDFYSITGGWLGIPPQFIGFESASVTAQRG